MADKKGKAAWEKEWDEVRVRAGLMEKVAEFLRSKRGWQGPPGSSSWSGNLTLSVNLENLGNGVLSLWCIMPYATPRMRLTSLRG